MAKLSLSQLAQYKETLRQQAAEQRIVLAQTLPSLAPIWQWSKVGFTALGMFKGMTGIFGLINLFRGKTRRRSSSKMTQFLFGLTLGRKLLDFFRRRR